MRAIERVQRRDLLRHLIRLRLRQRQMRRDDTSEHVVFARGRPHFPRGLARGNLAASVALQDTQGVRVGRSTCTAWLGFAPAASLTMSFHTSSAELIRPRSSAKLSTARVVATTTTSSKCSR